ncbi:MAG: hypothetical protein CL454_00445 [Acidimicrobiaceae bacterium]|nr:hypothetical protein [Acidimicrobiaceae bacterium]
MSTAQGSTEEKKDSTEETVKWFEKTFPTTFAAESKKGAEKAANKAAKLTRWHQAHRRGSERYNLRPGRMFSLDTLPALKILMTKPQDAPSPTVVVYVKPKFTRLFYLWVKALSKKRLANTQHKAKWEKFIVQLDAAKGKVLELETKNWDAVDRGPYRDLQVTLNNKRLLFQLDLSTPQALEVGMFRAGSDDWCQPPYGDERKTTRLKFSLVYVGNINTKWKDKSDYHYDMTRSLKYHDALCTEEKQQKKEIGELEKKYTEAIGKVNTTLRKENVDTAVAELNKVNELQEKYSRRYKNKTTTYKIVKNAIDNFVVDNSGDQFVRWFVQNNDGKVTTDFGRLLCDASLASNLGGTCTVKTPDSRYRSKESCSETITGPDGTRSEAAAEQFVKTYNAEKLADFQTLIGKKNEWYEHAFSSEISGLANLVKNIARPLGEIVVTACENKVVADAKKAKEEAKVKAAEAEAAEKKRKAEEKAAAEKKFWKGIEDKKKQERARARKRACAAAVRKGQPAVDRWSFSTSTTTKKNVHPDVVRMYEATEALCKMETIPPETKTKILAILQPLKLPTVPKAYHLHSFKDRDDLSVLRVPEGEGLFEYALKSAMRSNRVIQTIRLGPGTHRRRAVQTLIEITNNINIVGEEGATLDVGKLHFQDNCAVVIRNVTIIGGVKAEGSAKVTLTGVTMQNIEDCGVKAEGSAKVTLTDVTMQNIEDCGVKAEDNAKVECTNLRVSGDDDGVGVYAEGCNSSITLKGENTKMSNLEVGLQARTCWKKGKEPRSHVEADAQPKLTLQGLTIESVCSENVTTKSKHVNSENAKRQNIIETT